MRAIEYCMFGDPAEVLELADLPDPVPGPGQVRVRMSTRPINPSDLYTVRGRYGYLPSLPAVPGLEGCGVIEELGPGVTDYEVGQRVIPFMIHRGGSWSEYVIVNADEHGLIPAPDALSDGQAAQFAVNPLSAWLMVHRLGLSPGDWLAQTAGASQVGRTVAKIGASAGLQVINIVSTRSRAAELRAEGAKFVVSKEDGDLAAQLKAVTGGQGVHGALDAVGGALAADLARVLCPGARLIVYGLLAGRTTPFDTFTLLFQANTIEGFWLSAVYRNEPDAFAHAARELAAHPRLPGLIAQPESAYDLVDFAKAIHHAEQSGRSGKILLVS